MAKSNKPIVWGLFAVGGTVAAFCVPALILAHGLLVPLGVFGENALSYERVSAVIGFLPVKIVVLGVVILTLWHAAHRIRVTMHDFGIRKDDMVAMLCYGAAGLLTATALLGVMAV
ncbi:fumarate reductase subunit FrdD [Roseospira visakhapatnamensis]|uniref:Fumarate reductase subunit D n=1 Tax=Roseospira visakhapatnamensis TaxID=390880 RepID=A0A7W6RBP0_9PROT|nr:fumarate reductase subunit FrdD [Roseospira visakhapatnamensis]MBB4265186.1 fumarate reductase subunit D [Roseospira visakhapatnamensis]